MFSVNPLRRIWVVDDDPLMHEIWLAALGNDPEFELALFYSGADVVEALNIKHGPQLLIVDMNLADSTGEQLLKRLRREQSFQRTAVIVCSAKSHPSCHFNDLMPSPIGRMDKPLHFPDIKKSVCNIWGNVRD